MFVFRVKLTREVWTRPRLICMLFVYIYTNDRVWLQWKRGFTQLSWNFQFIYSFSLIPHKDDANRSLSLHIIGHCSSSDILTCGQFFFQFKIVTRNCSKMGKRNTSNRTNIPIENVYGTRHNICIPGFLLVGHSLHVLSADAWQGHWKNKCRQGH